MRLPLLFIALFALGVVLSVAVRTATHHPYAATHAAAPAAAPAMPAADMASPLPATTAATAGTINSICPGCGDPVNPAIPGAVYKGQRIGFNCAMCPPKFAADPLKYGEAALKNRMAE